MRQKLRDIQFFLTIWYLLRRLSRPTRPKTLRTPRQKGMRTATSDRQLSLDLEWEQGAHLYIEHNRKLAAAMLRKSRKQSPARVLNRAKGIFGLASALLPARVVDEELGDALEDVNRRLKEGRPRYEINLKIWGAVFWATFHSTSYALKRLGKAVSSFRSTSK